MDVLNEVEDLFKKLEAVPVDIKEAAFQKIVEKLSNAEGKTKKKEVTTAKKRPVRKRKREEKSESQVEPFEWYGSEGHDSEYVVVNILTSRGRKAQRICYTQMKHLSDIKKRECRGIQSQMSTSVRNVTYEIEDKVCRSNGNLVIDEKKSGHNIDKTSDLDVAKKISIVSEEPLDVEDVDSDTKLESSFEESQLVIVDPDGQESAEEGDTEVEKLPEVCTPANQESDIHKSEQENENAAVEKTIHTRSEPILKKTEESLTCSECLFKTHSEVLLRSHMRKHVGLRPHKCPDCGKLFPQASALKVHLKRHRGQRDFPCDFGCSYRAYTKVDKQRHMALHTGERSYQCQYCGKAFGKDSTLREHVKSVHERPNKHICPTCGFSTYRANNLRVHISMRHRGEYNNHVCPVCGAKVKQRTAFLDHMRSHTGERPYKCPLCTSSFTCLARLTVHRKAVHGPREFICKHCQKTFQTKHHMERHELIHTNQKPYACPFCSYTCNTQGNVTKHVKGVHSKPDFSYRKFKADQQVDADCKAMKSEWIEKGEKLTAEYLRDLSKKQGKEVTLAELKEREAEKNKRLTEDAEQMKKRRTKKQEHDYHSKVSPEDQLEDEVDEPTAVLLSVASTPADNSSGNLAGSTGISQTHVLHGVTINRSANAQPTLFIQAPRDANLQPVLSDTLQRSNNEDSSFMPGQNIQFCVNERMPLEDQVPLHVIYHSSPQSANSTSQENVTSDLSGSKYIKNINFVEVKGDAASSQTVVVIINTDNHEHLCK